LRPCGGVRRRPTLVTGGTASAPPAAAAALPVTATAPNRVQPRGGGVPAERKMRILDGLHTQRPGVADYRAGAEVWATLLDRASTGGRLSTSYRVCWRGGKARAASGLAPATHPRRPFQPRAGGPAARTRSPIFRVNKQSTNCDGPANGRNYHPGPLSLVTSTPAKLVVGLDGATPPR